MKLSKTQTKYVRNRVVVSAGEKGVVGRQKQASMPCREINGPYLTVQLNCQLD